MNKQRLSHSAISKYAMCPKMYEYHYIKKIRPTIHSAALVFGDSFDKAINTLIKGEKTLEEAINFFIESFKNNTINNKNVYIPTYTQLVYSASDFDADLLSEDNLSIIKERYPTIEDPIEEIKKLKNQKKAIGWENMSNANKTFFNDLHWMVLCNKGVLFINAYHEQVVPKLLKVHEVQRVIKIENMGGDSIIGYVDLIADLEGHGTVILDNKTSSMEYEEDSVLTSPQLSLYLHALEDEYKTRKAGYIVLNKNLIKNKKKICSKCGYDGSGKTHKKCDNEIDGKRCNGEWNTTTDPKVNIQIIVDEIPIKTEEIVMENYDAINKGIKSGVFHRNFNTCENCFGSRCAYKDLCFKDNMRGLEDMNKENRDDI